MNDDGWLIGQPDMPRIYRAPVATTDVDGAPILIFRTACGSTFKIDAEDGPLIGEGPFYLNSNGHDHRYVRTGGLDNLTMVARLVTRAGRGQIVRYRDNDRTNLRANNLCMDSGFAKRRDVDLMPPQQEQPHA